MNLAARIAIEALRAGVPNREAVRLLGTEQTDIEQGFEAALHRAWADGARPGTGLGIAGDFGTGKSHLLGYLSEVALAQGFVVSRVVVSKETPLSDPVRLFQAALREAALPERNDDPMTASLADCAATPPIWRRCRRRSAPPNPASRRYSPPCCSCSAGRRRRPSGCAGSRNSWPAESWRRPICGRR